ncbi:MAG: SiaB family protein kinase [Bacteroidales bacterium]|nr:SiaB family protein kinase [Bacteroidales bacterium]
MKKQKNDAGTLGFVYNFFTTMQDNDINLIYEGEITHQITKAFLTLTEASLEKSDDSNTVQKRVFHVMVECLQNITKHGDKIDESEIIDKKFSKGILLVGKCDDEYFVTTGNIIKNDKIDGLSVMLVHINSLNKEELRALYIKQLNEGKLSDKGGAGLGFIDIARKTGRKLDYEFHPINENYSFFVLKMKISRQKH